VAAEKNFEVKVKKWLESIGVYPLGTAKQKMKVTPCGYYEKRWGGGYSKSGLPDMHIVVNAINIDVELKAPTGRPSEIQKHNITQINDSGCIGVILYPDRFDDFKTLVEGVRKCSGHTAGLKRLKNALSISKCAIWKGQK
jgi:hypothetical protein